MASWAGRAAIALLVWGAALVLKPLLGYGMKAAAHHYVHYYNAHHGSRQPRVNHLDKKAQASARAKRD